MNETVTPYVHNSIQRAIIADLGRIGYDFFEAINDVVTGGLSPEERENINGHMTAVKKIYDGCLLNLIRWYGQTPNETIENIKNLPTSDMITETVWVIPFSGFDKLNLICQEYCIAIYLHLQRQYPYIVGSSYIPVTIGYDYLVMQEIRPSCVWASSEIAPISIPGADPSNVERRVFVDCEGTPVILNIQDGESIRIGSDNKVLLVKYH